MTQPRRTAERRSPVARTKGKPARAYRIFRVGALCFLPAATAVAQESGTGADSILVATSTRPAVDLAGRLPELSGYLGEGIPSKISAEWAASWTVGAARGRARRLEVYRQLRISGLDVDSATAEAAVSSAGATVEAVRGIENGLPLHLSLSYAEAERLWQGARTRLRAGSWGEASLLALQSADALREMMPRTVALTLIEAAEAALSAPTAPDLTPEATGRAQRLVQWAHTAVISGNYTRAIPRAYYACRLAGVILP